VSVINGNFMMYGKVNLAINFIVCHKPDYNFFTTTSPIPLTLPPNKLFSLKMLCYLCRQIANTKVLEVPIMIRSQLWELYTRSRVSYFSIRGEALP